MNELEEKIALIKKQEEELQFDSFTNEMALELGLKFVEKAREKNLKVAIDINRAGQQLFHYACSGTTPDNDQWILRKSRVVKRFQKSSLHMWLLLQKLGKTLDQHYYVNPLEYTASGGAFPLTVRGCGVIGTITVSGLPHMEDHEFVVDVLSEYLKEIKK
jgi:uncharacterized protein (UPF0303 family)